MEKKDKIAIAGIVATIVAAIIAGGATIISANISKSETDTSETTVIDNSTKIDNSVINDEQTTIIQEGNTFVENQTFVDETTVIDAVDYDFGSKTVQQLLMMANNACLKQEYNYAFDIYSCSKLQDTEVALINLGYIYANGLSYEGINIEKAEECYNKVNCIEAKRNLLALYIKTNNENKKELFDNLLREENDDITWNYVSKCLYNQTWETFSTENGIVKDEFVFNISELYKLEETGEYYRGYNPPEDTDISKWIIENLNHDTESPKTYFTYQLYKIVYSKYINELENLYYKKDSMFYTLDI